MKLSLSTILATAKDHGRNQVSLYELRSCTLKMAIAVPPRSSDVCGPISDIWIALVAR